MHPLNPYLRAFFRSTLPSQCHPVHHHVLLVPTTEVLFTSRDRDTGAIYADLAASEDFLASHVLRVPGGVASPAQGRDANNIRENRAKAKQYSTANGRTVIVKDAFVYSNKGFKASNQAQLLHDTLYYPDALDAQAWVVYFISRPLVGTFEAITVLPASISKSGISRNGTHTVSNEPPTYSDSSSESKLLRKKEINSFGDLLNNFPIISRQMQPGLERILRDFARNFEKPLPPVPSQVHEIVRRTSSASSQASRLTNGQRSQQRVLEPSAAEELMKKSLESAVMAAIDLFQMVDKQQLSFLGSTTDLTGSVVERMIERYITEQVHDAYLFPQLCAVRRSEDTDLELHMRHMTDIDISQVGISLSIDFEAKKSLASRIGKAVDVFRKMGMAGSPQEMIEILLNTQKSITNQQTDPPPHSQAFIEDTPKADPEKTADTLTINADALVSLLLIVLIRSSVRHLHARLSYMRHFTFIDDVESGEMGYALSTFEAVLSYLTRDSAGLRKSSRRNRRLWQAIRNGSLEEVKPILEPGNSESAEDSSARCGFGATQLKQDHAHDMGLKTGAESWDVIDQSGEHDSGTLSSGDHVHTNGALRPGPLAHIFPFQRAPSPSNGVEWSQGIKARRRVSVETYSTSSSSGFSYTSLNDTISFNSNFHGTAATPSELARTHSSSGESLLMMAVSSGHEDILRYLLSLTTYYSWEFVLEDTDNEGTTLLSAAVQTGRSAVIDMVLEYVQQKAPDQHTVRRYFTRQDAQGRSVAHYLFHQPRLISKIGSLLPWTLKDRNGQTPLFALCRSYDHEDYSWMVNTALSAATEAQADGPPLHLDDHVDGKGNTLLHIVNDPQLAVTLLTRCDSDINAPNDKKFTPLMVASKYGRIDLVHTLFGDPRVDLYARELRGLTAVELAKDDEIRNRMDDLLLLATPPTAEGRSTAVVRSFFVEDGSIRLVLKSGIRHANSTVTVTTCRRSLSEFESLAAWLAIENPASWLPSVSSFPSPYLIPSRPSRSVLRDIQVRLDNFLRILLSHSTFSTHEMVWEFFLVPEVDHAMLSDRTKRKAELRAERVRDEYTPVTNVREVELFVSHARDTILGVHHSTKSVLRRTNRLRLGQVDLYDAMALASSAVSGLQFLPRSHRTAIDRYAKTLAVTESDPFTTFYYNFHAISTTIHSILTALTRPVSLISSMSVSQKTIERHNLSMRRSDRWPLGLLDETRQKVQRDATEKTEKAKSELESLGKELRYTQQVVAGELASWQEERVKMGRAAVRELARRMVVVERARLEAIKRAIREIHKPV